MPPMVMLPWCLVLWVILLQEVPIANKSQLDVNLVETPKALSEVVVVGYGTQKRVDLTGSVGSVKW
jgi:hypothetical protein